MRRLSLAALVFGAASVTPNVCIRAQQVADTSFVPRVTLPEYGEGKGPTICVDASHLNVHTVDGQFQAFAKLARRDGFPVRALNVPPPFASGHFESCRVLVIASPRNSATLKSRKRPIANAYTAEEAASVRKWVQNGGALLLIADHMPVVGSMQNLLHEFSLDVLDGFAQTVDSALAREPIVFRRADGTLRAHPITDGRTAAERIDSIATFTGAAFRPTSGISALWQLPAATEVIIPDEPFVFLQSSPRIPSHGLLQGAAFTVGRGRVVFSAEAGMFTAQKELPRDIAIGMNHRVAGQNAQLVLNILHWLAAADGLR